ncbi:MAG: hypothetical protein H5T68_07720 [Chloroflexi bacterium]|nr:hypothetical protein [Chloroflexota bacterium]
MGVALQVYKRGRLCVIAKLVWAEPLGELVLAMPYRNRQAVNVVSLPVDVLAYARRQGAQLWVVRMDKRGACYALPLRDVERCGWLWQGEWFVALSRFERITWQDWPFVEQKLVFGDKPAKQLTLGLEYA